MLEYNYKSLSIIDKFLDIVSSIVVNMIVVIMATKLFRNISVDNMFYLFITATLIMIMNKCVKPLIKVVMLPLNIFTLGLTYPLVNVIVLKLISLLLSPHFIISGWFGAFFISIFISIMTIIIDFVIGKSIRGGRV